ncbi:MAG: PQQ-dependent sugar dehydrogenase [Ignavibacteria bacterium]|nr:PQQ-dependent sugar dehydrogenase [Ignavibacteria bacterium]
MNKTKILLTILFSLFLIRYSNSQPPQLVNAFLMLHSVILYFNSCKMTQTNRVFVIGKIRKIKVMPNDSNTTNVKVFLDVTNLTIYPLIRERGLLGLAFHPNYASNGYFYIYYTRIGDGANVLVKIFKKY